MKIDHLRYFIKTAQCSSINIASQKLYITQPSLSSAIRSLEEELGTTLFIRNYNGIELSEMGKKLLPMAEQLIEIYYKMKELGKNGIPEEKKLNISVTRYLCKLILYSPIMELANNKHINIVLFPAMFAPPSLPPEKDNCRFHIRSYSKNCLQRVEEAAGKLGWTMINIFQVRGCIYLNASSEFANRDFLDQNDLSKLVFACPFLAKSEQLNPTYNLVQNLKVPKIIYLQNEESIFEYVMSNPNAFAFYSPIIGFAQESVRQGNIIIKYLKGIPDQIYYCLFYSKKAYISDEDSEFLDLLKEQIQRLSQYIIKLKK